LFVSFGLRIGVWPVEPHQIMSFYKPTASSNIRKQNTLAKLTQIKDTNTNNASAVLNSENSLSSLGNSNILNTATVLDKILIQLVEEYYDSVLIAEYVVKQQNNHIQASIAWLQSLNQQAQLLRAQYKHKILSLQQQIQQKRADKSQSRIKQYQQLKPGQISANNAANSSHSAIIAELSAELAALDPHFDPAEELFIPLQTNSEWKNVSAQYRQLNQSFANQPNYLNDLNAAFARTNTSNNDASSKLQNSVNQWKECGVAAVKQCNELDKDWNNQRLQSELQWKQRVCTSNAAYLSELKQLDEKTSAASNPSNSASKWPESVQIILNKGPASNSYNYSRVISPPQTIAAAASSKLFSKAHQTSTQAEIHRAVEAENQRSNGLVSYLLRELHGDVYEEFNRLLSAQKNEEARNCGTATAKESLWLYRLIYGLLIHPKEGRKLPVFIPKSAEE
jgi:hypothetical protein